MSKYTKYALRVVQSPAGRRDIALIFSTAYALFKVAHGVA